MGPITVYFRTPIHNTGDVTFTELIQKRHWVLFRFIGDTHVGSQRLREPKGSVKPGKVGIEFHHLVPHTLLYRTEPATMNGSSVQPFYLLSTLYLSLLSFIVADSVDGRSGREKPEYFFRIICQSHLIFLR